MTPELPEKELPTPAPVRNPARAWLALIAIAVLFAALAMAYRESTRSTTRVLDAANVSSKTGLEFNIYAQPRALPNLRFADGSGRAMTLQDFRGKVVLLNIWATWCPPCRQEMPTLDRLQAKLGGPDFDVVALSIDQGPQSRSLIQKFYLQSGIKSLATYIDASGDASRDLGAAGLPTTLLIDRQGRELGRKIGLAEWDSMENINLIRGHLAAQKSNQRGNQ